MAKREVFSARDAQMEIERLERAPNDTFWSPQNGFSFKLIIPPTVYPPREDTDLMAKRIIALGPGKGRKFLEIGCGSGALSILAASMGWKVSGCDINPFAVAATIGNLAENKLTGEIREGGIGPDGFPFTTSFDLIIWNLPYISHLGVDEVLGPIEEAALIDTDDEGLGVRLVRSIVSKQLLSINGRILILGRRNSIKEPSIFAHRIWDQLTFQDGEELTLICLWRPYEGAENILLETTGSTNDDLLNKNGVGTHIASKFQTSGKGRRNRTWASIEGSYAGSWIVAEGFEINPGHLQLAGALAVLNSLSNDERLILKWPNDILIGKRKLCGILAEGKSSGKRTKVVLGIGINLKAGKHNEDIEISSLDELMDMSHQEFDKSLNRELASLLEEGENLPPIRYSEVRDQILAKMRLSGNPEYNGKKYDTFGLNDCGELLLGNYVVDDGEEVNWN